MTQLMLGSALQQIAGPLADFAQKLSGPDGNTKWLPAFKRFLRGENPWDGKPMFRVWRTITLGQRESIHDLIAALDYADILVHQDIRTALGRTKLIPTSEHLNIELTKVSFRDIGFPDGAHYAVAKRRLAELGLGLCSMDMVAEARLAYLDQDDEDECLEFAISSIEMPNGTHLLPDLRINEENGRLEICACAEEDNFPGPNVELICVLLHD